MVAAVDVCLQHLPGAVQVDNLHAGLAIAEAVAVGAAQGGAGNDGVLARAQIRVDPARDDVEPGRAVSGVPAAIFSRFATGCSRSPSWNIQPSSAATRSATVVLPEPETPITTTTRLTARASSRRPGRPRRRWWCGR